MTFAGSRAEMVDKDKFTVTGGGGFSLTPHAAPSGSSPKSPFVARPLAVVVGDLFNYPRQHTNRFYCLFLLFFLKRTIRKTQE